MRTFVAAIALIATLAAAGKAGANPQPEYTFELREIEGTDQRLYSGDGDWRYGFSKNECGGSFPIMVALAADNNIEWSIPVGLYTYYTNTLAAELCASSDTVFVEYGPNSSGSYWFGGGSGDQRRDTSTGDWAYGYTKAECANNEVLTGVAEQGEGINEFHCTPAQTYAGLPLVASSCEPVDFDMHDGYDSFPGSNRGDWESGVDKGNCGKNRYIKGFSVDTLHGTTTKPNKVLCCGAELMWNGGPCSADEQCAGGTCGWPGICL